MHIHIFKRYGCLLRLHLWVDLVKVVAIFAMSFN